jgi:signal peptidase I
MPEVGRAQTYHYRWTGPAAAAAAVAAAALAWAWWRPFRVAVDGDSMEPAFHAGDWLVATGRGRRRPGAVVVAEHPHRPGFDLVKRVRHGPGDAAPDLTTLATDQYWIEGDRPDRSTDSRAFGPVTGAAIRGVVRFRYSSDRRRRYRSAMR